MAGMSSYLENMLLNWHRGTAFAAAPAALYVALFNGDPTDAGTGGAEVTTTIRAAGRPVVTLAAPAGGAATSNAVTSFGNAAGAATVTHFAIFDSAAGGNMLDSNALSGGSQAVAAGTAVSFAAGALVLQAS